jgi:hypothetical protein
MTTYEKELARTLEERYGDIPAGRLFEKLCRMGVVDYTRCKTLVVRQYVDMLVKEGRTKTDAMWMAAEKFVCSYECVRKYVYYYTDINIL